MQKALTKKLTGAGSAENGITAKRGFLYYFMRSPKGMIGLTLLVIIVLAVTVIPLFMDLDPEKVYFVVNKAPSSQHILGLDTSFQDCFAKLIMGGRVSLLVGGGTSLITLIIGVPLGLIAGFYQKRIGAGINRTAEIFLSFPVMVLLMLMVAVFSRVTPLIIILVMGVVSWPGTTKMLYSMVISVMNDEYVTAAKAMGKSSFAIMFQDVLPNSITPVLVSLPFRISISIMLETTLAFLGLGVATSWGRQIYLATTMNVMINQMWMWLPATICLVVVIVSVNMLGEGIRDSFDPKSARNG